MGFPRQNVTVLKDEGASKAAIMESYLSLADKAANPDDRVIVFFAGHGVTTRGIRGEIGYLAPVDADMSMLYSLIRWDDLTRNADVIAAKHLLFIIDACYSGLALQRNVPPGTKRFVSENLQRLARQVITAGKADETVADGGGPTGINSIFTGHLVDGLQGGAADSHGVITANGLMHYVYQKVGNDTRSKQTPHFGHFEGDGDFILRLPSGSDFITETKPEQPEPLLPKPASGIRATYAERFGYADSTRSDFGRNEWSNRLGEERWGANKSIETVKAYSWLSLIFQPIVDEFFSINLAEQLESLKKPSAPSGNPLEDFSIPPTAITTLNSIVLYDEVGRDRSLWKGYVRLERDGSLEYATSLCVFGEFDGVRHFRYVLLIGLIGQFVHLAKRVLANSQYNKGGRLLVNLVGTRDTVLTHFSREPGENQERWSSFENDAWGERGYLLNLKCHDPNIQVDCRLVLDNIDEVTTKTIMDEAASQLGLAYNHQSNPRCYNYNTDIFPWGLFTRFKREQC